MLPSSIVSGRVSGKGEESSIGELVVAMAFDEVMVVVVQDALWDAPDKFSWNRG
jgi:hypothetical protein